MPPTNQKGDRYWVEVRGRFWAVADLAGQTCDLRTGDPAHRHRADCTPNPRLHVFLVRLRTWYRPRSTLGSPAPSSRPMLSVTLPLRVFWTMREHHPLASRPARDPSGLLPPAAVPIARPRPLPLLCVPACRGTSTSCPSSRPPLLIMGSRRAARRAFRRHSLRCPRARVRSDSGGLMVGARGPARVVLGLTRC